MLVEKIPRHDKGLFIDIAVGGIGGEVDLVSDFHAKFLRQRLTNQDSILIIGRDEISGDHSLDDGRVRRRGWINPV